MANINPIQEPDTARILLDAGAGAVKPNLYWADAEDRQEPDVMTVVVPSGYRIEAFDVAKHLARHRAAPRRVAGTAVVSDTASWLAYFGKHGDDSAEVYGDVTKGTVTAVLNAPAGPNAPGWGDHRVVLQLTRSAAWDAWVAHDGTLLTQGGFAEHVEARSPDFVRPDAATMLELAQTFQQTTSVKFEAGHRLRDGQTRFAYLETTEAKAGSRGSIDVPSEFEIMLQPWRGVGLVIPVTARLRSRATAEGLRLGYVLDRLEDVEDTVWAKLLGELTDTLPVPVLAGTAPVYG